MVPQVFPVLRREDEGEVFGKAVLIAGDRSIQHLGLDAVKLGQIGTSITGPVDGFVGTMEDGLSLPTFLNLV